MALSEVNKLHISKIIGVSPRDLDIHIASLGGYLTAEVETQVIAEITRWTTGAGSDFTKVHPRERNFGAEINPSDAKADIRKNIMTLLLIDASQIQMFGFGSRTLRG